MQTLPTPEATCYPPALHSAPRRPLVATGIAVRIFLTCWLVFVLHFATNTVRELYPVMSLGDHLSFDVSEYLGFHPDIFELPGRGAYINNNPGASIVGAIPYFLTRPLIDRVVDWQRRVRAAAPEVTQREYDTLYPMAREFYQKARERGLDVKFGLAAAVTQALCMAPLSALSAVVMFSILASCTASVRVAAVLACLFAIATPVFYRTAQLNQNLLVSNCALFAFALLWRPWDDSGSSRPVHFLGAGLLSGWAVVCDYSGLVVVAAMGLYAIARWRSLPTEGRQHGHHVAWFVGGVFASGAVLLGYQWWCFGNPLYPAQHYMPPATYTPLGYVGMDWPHLDLLWATAFNMRFGLFTSAPLLLLALYPPAWFSERVRIVGAREARYIAVFCVLFFLFCSANQYGRMQFNSGVRHVVPVAPFLFLIAAGTLLRMPPVVATCVGIATAYWSWCLSMYRDVEQGLGVFESLIHVTLEGFRLPWLSTLAHMGYVQHASAMPLLLLSAGLTWALWRVGDARALRPGPPSNRRRVRSLTGEAMRIVPWILLATAIGAQPTAAQNQVLVYSTYLGSTDEDTIRDVVADDQGNSYITGGTRSANFPVTAGAYDSSHNGNMDVFVAKLDPSGHILWATFLGGPNYDRTYAIELDSQGNVIVAGRAGVGFPTTSGVVQPAFAGDTVPNALYGPQDGFIAKLSANGTQLLWATYWGTDDACIIRDIAVDAADNLYPAGCIMGGHVSQYITPGAFQTSKPGLRDGVVAKLNPTATQVLWCSYVGGSDDDAATPSVRVDGTGVYFVSGTFSTDAPTTVGAYRRTLAGTGTTDMYVAKLAPNGASLLWGTYLGGANNEFSETHAVALDAQHNVYIAATTSSTDFPTTAGVVQPSYGGSGGAGSGAGTNYPGDGFVAKLSADGHQLLASTYVGGSAGEGIEGVTVGPDGSAYISGATFSGNFPSTADAFQPTNHGAGDMFAVRLSADLTARLYSTYLGGSGADFGRSSTVDANGNFVVVGMTDSADWPRVGSATSHGGTWDGVVAKLVTADSNLCTAAAAIHKPHLTLSRLDTPGESVLRFTGEFLMSPGFPGLASTTDGIRIVLEDLGGGAGSVLLLDVGPGGEPSACGDHEGWSSSDSSTSSFRTRIDAVTNSNGNLCSGPGSAKGIVRLKTSQTGSTIKFRVIGRHGTYVASGPLRAQVILGAGDASAAATNGYCGAIAFAYHPSAQPACKVTTKNGIPARIACN